MATISASQRQDHLASKWKHLETLISTEQRMKQPWDLREVPSPLWLCGCVMKEHWGKQSSEPSSPVKMAKGCLLRGREGDRGLGLHEEIIIKVPCKVSSPGQAWGPVGMRRSVVPASPGACILPQPSTCSDISRQHITSSELWGVSHTPGIKAQFPRKANFAKGWRKRHRLIKFSWSPPPILPRPPTSSRPKAQRQVPVWHNEKGDRMWERHLKFQRWECSPDSLINPSLLSEHPSSRPTSKHKPVWLEFYLPHVPFLPSDQPFWTGNFIIKGNIPCCPRACVSNTKRSTLAIKKLINDKVCTT